MQLFAHIPYTANQFRLHKRVNIFIAIRGKGESAFVQIFLYGLQTCDDLISLRFRHNALLGQHFDMSQTALNILMIKAVVEGNGRCEGSGCCSCCLGETTTPELRHSSFLLVMGLFRPMVFYHNFFIHAIYFFINKYAFYP